VLFITGMEAKIAPKADGHDIIVLQLNTSMDLDSLNLGA
jgi:hypothetical protein